LILLNRTIIKNKNDTKNQKLFTLDDEPHCSYSFLPIVQAFIATAGIEMETKDISLAANFIQFPEFLNEQK
jgi:isocitrate dehydrogenase